MYICVLISSGAVRVYVLAYCWLPSAFGWATATPEHRKKSGHLIRYRAVTIAEPQWKDIGPGSWAAVILCATRLLEWSSVQNNRQAFVAETNGDGFLFCPSERFRGSVACLLSRFGESTRESWWVLDLGERQVSLTPIITTREGIFGVAMGLSVEAPCVAYTDIYLQRN